MWFHVLHNVVPLLCESSKTGGKEIAAVTRVFVLFPFFTIRALDGYYGEGEWGGGMVCGMKSGEWSEGPIIYPAYLNSARWKVGVSLSIPRGIISASSTMTSVTSFMRTPRGLPRGQWAPCRTDDTRDETSSLLCGHEAHFNCLLRGEWNFGFAGVLHLVLLRLCVYVRLLILVSRRVEDSVVFPMQILLI